MLRAKAAALLRACSMRDGAPVSPYISGKFKPSSMFNRWVAVIMSLASRPSAARSTCVSHDKALSSTLMAVRSDTMLLVIDQPNSGVATVTLRCDA